MTRSVEQINAEIERLSFERGAVDMLGRLNSRLSDAMRVSLWGAAYVPYADVQRIVRDELTRIKAAR